MLHLFSGDEKASVEFVILSFEGPDSYSFVGGLAVRVTEMTKALAKRGFSTRLFFVGDPDKQDYEAIEGGRLHYHRWSRWLSKQYPDGVYHGEAAKVEDFQASLPEFLVEHIVSANAEDGVLTVILGEDWQTAKALSRTAELLKGADLSENAVLFWNANNVFGFEKIDFVELQSAVHLLTISRYMKERMRALGLDAMVLPNGIPPRFWSKIDTKAGKKLRAFFPGLLLSKIGRYHPDKRWLMAIEALAHYQTFDRGAKLVVRGGKEEYGKSLRKTAEELGLVWAKVRPKETDIVSILGALKENLNADILEFDSFVPESFLRLLYWSSDAVLANSGHEPFGLVGLEVMACGGVAITGSTGEEYIQHFHNGIALSSDEPRELALYLRDLAENPPLSKKLRACAQDTAKVYDWDHILDDFFRKIELVYWMEASTF